MPKANRPTRQCEVCKAESDRLFRVRSVERDWQLICRACYDTISNEPGFTYGGTWTNRKRKK